MLRGMWDLSSQTRDRTHITCTGSQPLKHQRSPHPLFFQFFSHGGLYRLLSRIPCAISQIIFSYYFGSFGLPCGSAGKESTSNVGDLGSIPGLGRSPRERKRYSLQYSGLENSMDSLVHPWGCKESDTTE